MVKSEKIKSTNPCRDLPIIAYGLQKDIIGIFANEFELSPNR